MDRDERRKLRNALAAVERDRDDARTRYIQGGERLALIEMEANAIADALGQRGLLDFADDVRMLAKMASTAYRATPVSDTGGEK